MDETLERELKLQPDADFAMPVWPGELLEPRLFTSTYYDTPPRSLARCGITLRCRVEADVARWQLKLPRDAARAELEAVAGPDAAPDAVPDEIDALLVAHRRYGELEAVATLETQRVGVRVVFGDRSLADVVLDSVKVLTAGRVADTFEEVEVELVDGDEDDLERLGARLRGAGARRTKGTPKLMRVLELEDESAPPRKAPPVDHIRYLLSCQLRELETHDPGVRLGGASEDLHRLRVVTRRSRALIRASRPLLGDRLAALGAELRWLGGVLGPARDLDVLVEHLRELAGTLDEDAAGAEAIVARLEEERGGAREAVLEALGSERYFALLARFADDIGAPLQSHADGHSDGDSDIELADIARAEARRLRKAYAALGPEPEDERLHEVRIDAKRLRYAAELAAQSNGKPLSRLADAARELQDVIGSHQDAVVAEERVRAVVDASSSLAAGRIVALEHARRRDAREQLPETWKRVKRAIGKAF